MTHYNDLYEYPPDDDGLPRDEQLAEYVVKVSFEFKITAVSEEDAEKIADAAFLSYVDHPQTGERIKPVMETEKVEQ